jgi:condensin complex subunit 1
LPIKYPKRRQRVAELALRSLKDKSNHVRKNAVKLLSKLISTHPYGVLHGGTLKLSEWTERLQKLDEEINVLVPPIDEIANQSMHNQTTDPELLDDVTDDENEKSGNRTETTSNLSIQPPSEEVAKLQLTRRYYVEAIRFIETIHNSSEIATQLLSAKNKSEVIEAMDFFKILDVYKIETAKVSTMV